jgi:hypothetical protein
VRKEKDEDREKR